MFEDACMEWELPPRARRILQLHQWLYEQIGTTSACAENTVRSGCRRRPWRNYLRVRGEYLTYHTRSCILMELPPRARRIPISAQAPAQAYRTTSACAENTIVAAYGRGSRGNYLRVRGEYFK